MIIIALKANSNNFFKNQNIKMGKPTFMKNGFRKWGITFFFFFDNFFMSLCALEKCQMVDPILKINVKKEHFLSTERLS